MVCSKRSLVVYFFLLVLLSVLWISCAVPLDSSVRNISRQQSDNKNISVIAQKWLSADRALKKLSSMMIKRILPHAIRMGEGLNISSGCSRGLFKFLTGFKQTKLWAFQMLDSFGKLPNGILSGTINSLGDYDLCIDTNVPGHFKGQYCTVDIKPALPKRKHFDSYEELIPEFVNITDPQSVTTRLLALAKYFYHLNIRSSICVPSTCSRNDIETMASKGMELVGLEFKVIVPNCETKLDKIVFSTKEIVIIVVLCTLLFLAAVSTATDVAMRLQSSEENYTANTRIITKYLLCFSLYSNIIRLLKKDSSPDSIHIFHGMKVVTTLWVILCHTYIYWNLQAMSSTLNTRRMHKEFMLGPVTNGFICVETFLFISGVLVSYGVLKMKGKNINIFLYIFKRVWRLTPPLMLVVSLVYLIPHLGSGPVWKETVVDRLTHKCESYWWTNLLYINNFITYEEMCLKWTWYISVDTQLYLVSLIALIPLKRNSRFGLMMIAALIVIATVLTAAFQVYYKLPPITLSTYVHPDDVSYFTDLGYHRPYLHCSTYCLGLLVGYILAKKPKINIGMRNKVFAWFLSLALPLTVVYGVYYWNLGNVPGMLTSTVYACTSKFVFALGLSWVTVACMNGYGGIVTSILSWQALVPLSRLTYMTYLIHPIIQHMYFGSARTVIAADHRTLVFFYLGNIVMSYMCAFGLSLLFESPFMVLEKLFFSSFTLRSESSKTTYENSKREEVKNNQKNNFNLKKMDEIGIEENNLSSDVTAPSTKL